MLDEYLLKIESSDGVLHETQKAEQLFKDFKAEYFLAEKGYDSHHVVFVDTK